MMVLLFAVAAIALTLLALLLAGAVIAIVTAVALLNAFVLILGLRMRRPHIDDSARERWQPSCFRRPPEPDDESQEHLPPLKVHRL